MDGNSLFELGFLYGIGKPLILTDTPEWTKDSENIDNVIYLEKVDSEELKGAIFMINEKLKKNMAETFFHEKPQSYVKEKLEKISGILMEYDFSLSTIRTNKIVEITPEDKYQISEAIDEIENSGIEMAIEYYLTMGRFFFEIQEYKNAVSQFEKALEINEENIEALTDIGSSYYYAKKYDDAIEYLKKASEIDQENVYALHTMGMCYVHLKKYETAIEYFKKALKIKQDHEIFNDLGIIYNYLEEEDSKYYNAIDCFKSSLEIKNNARSWRNMGATYVHLKRYGESIECFKNVLKIEPDNVKIMSSIGEIYFHLRDHDNAIKYFKDAIEVEPNNADAHYALGLVYNNLKNYNEAITCLKRATDIDPEHVDAWWELGFNYTHFGDYNKALENFRKAAEIDNEYADAWNSMGAAYTKLGKYDKAGECYDKVVQIFPDYISGKLNVSENYIIRGRYEGAFRNANEALKSAKENKSGRDICMSYFFGIVSLLFQQKINDAKILINEFINYFSETPQKVDWDFSVIVPVIQNSHLDGEIKNLANELSDLLQNRISVDDFVGSAKAMDI